MTILTSPDDAGGPAIYVDLSNRLHRSILVRCEGLNLGGSIKMRTASYLINAALASGQLGSDTVLIESSSGNLGVALASVAAARGIKFICVTDSHCNAGAMQAIRALGGEVLLVEDEGDGTNLLEKRKSTIQALCARDPNLLWLNQYENPANWRAHYEVTAPMIAMEIPTIDVLFIGTGTGGTFVGCLEYFAKVRPQTKVVAVDAVGSVNFGGDMHMRFIPGLGASVPMPFLEGRDAQVVRVSELDAVDMCRRLASSGFLFGGSTGTVITGALAWLEANDPQRGLRAVAISADMGDRYLDTVYNDEWVSSTLRPANAYREAM